MMILKSLRIEDCCKRHCKAWGNFKVISFLVSSLEFHWNLIFSSNFNISWYIEETFIFLFDRKICDFIFKKRKLFKEILEIFSRIYNFTNHKIRKLRNFGILIDFYALCILNNFKIHKAWKSTKIKFNEFYYQSFSHDVTIESVIKFNGFNQKSSRCGEKFVKRQTRRKPRDEEGDQIERITRRESRSSEWGMESRRSKESEGGVGGERRGGSVCASRAREGLYDGGTSLSWSPSCSSAPH